MAAVEHVEHAALVASEVGLGAECTASAVDVVAVAYAAAAVVASAVDNEPHGWLVVGVQALA